MTKYNVMTRILIHLAAMLPDSVLGIPHRFPPIKSLEIRELNVFREQTATLVRDNGKENGRRPKAGAVRKRRDLVCYLTKAASSSQTTGAQASSESMRSRTPPWPGSSLPKSLIPRSRLIMEAARSPSTAAATAAAPRTAPCHQYPCSKLGSRIAPATTQVRAEPARPSHVFFGLMTGASLCAPLLPSVMPAA